MELWLCVFSPVCVALFIFALFFCLLSHVFFFFLVLCFLMFFFFFSSRRRHTRCLSDWSSDVCSSDLYSDDKDFVQKVVMGIAAHHGRVCIGGEKVAGQTVPPGTVMPQLLHGGPGRAGGGEELGGMREIGRASCREGGWGGVWGGSVGR